jgi:hypothetical protein
MENNECEHDFSVGTDGDWACRFCGILKSECES